MLEYKFMPIDFYLRNLFGHLSDLAAFCYRRRQNKQGARCGPIADRAHMQIIKLVKQMWTRCGLDVDSVLIPSPIYFQQMWTRPPFSIYNNKGGWGGESTSTPLQHCTRPRASKWGRIRDSMCQTWQIFPKTNSQPNSGPD